MDELGVLVNIYQQLIKVDKSARMRILAWLNSKLGSEDGFVFDSKDGLEDIKESFAREDKSMRSGKSVEGDESTDSTRKDFKGGFEREDEGKLEYERVPKGSLVDYPQISYYRDLADILEDIRSKRGSFTKADYALIALVYYEYGGGGKRLEVRTREINRGLQAAGVDLKNASRALTSLVDAQPQLAKQVNRHGETKQARRGFNATKIGIHRVISWLPVNK